MEKNDAPKQRESKLFHRVFPGLGVMAVCLIVSIGVTALVARINRAEFGVYLLPFAISVGIFLFSTLGFFLTEEKKEVLYGICSIAGAACAVVQLALVF